MSIQNFRRSDFLRNSNGAKAFWQIIQDIKQELRNKGHGKTVKSN